MKRYFVSYSFAVPNGNHGFGNTIVQVDNAPNTYEDFKEIADSISKAQTDPRMKDAGIVILYFKEMDHE